MSEQTSVNLPPSVVEVVEKIVQKTGLPTEAILVEYRKYLEEVQKNFPEYKNDEMRIAYVTQVLWANYSARGSTTEVDLIPIGFDAIRISKKNGDKWTRLYVITPNPDKTLAKHYVSFGGSDVEMLKSINYGARYKVKLTPYKSGDFGADNRARFESPQSMNIDILSLLKRVDVREVPSLSSANLNLSKMQPPTPTGSAYVDSLDWKIVSGIVTRANTFAKKDGSQGGAYNLNDLSLGQESHVDESGRVVDSTFTVWVDPAFVVWGADSKVNAVGTITVDPKGVCAMNAINIIPSEIRYPIKK